MSVTTLQTIYIKSSHILYYHRCLLFSNVHVGIWFCPTSLLFNLLGPFFFCLLFLLISFGNGMGLSFVCFETQNIDNIMTQQNWLR